MNDQKPQNMKEKLVKREIEIHDDGSATVIDNLRYTVELPARDFLTFTRQQKDAITNIDNQMSEDRKKILLEEKAKLEKLVEQAEPFLKDSETKSIAHNQKLELEQKTKALEDTFSKKPAERNNNMIQAIVQSLKEGDYEKIKKGLSKESYRAEFTRIMQDFRKQKARKK